VRVAVYLSLPIAAVAAGCIVVPQWSDEGDDDDGASEQPTGPPFDRGDRFSRDGRIDDHTSSMPAPFDAGTNATQPDAGDVAVDADGGADDAGGLDGDAGMAGDAGLIDDDAGVGDGGGTDGSADA
jgi:hypothetical protein